MTSLLWRSKAWSLFQDSLNTYDFFHTINFNIWSTFVFLLTASTSYRIPSYLTLILNWQPWHNRADVLIMSVLTLPVNSGTSLPQVYFGKQVLQREHCVLKKKCRASQWSPPVFLWERVFAIWTSLLTFSWVTMKLKLHKSLNTIIHDPCKRKTVYYKGQYNVLY